MKYTEPKFNVALGGEENYRNEWERIFGKKPSKCTAPYGHYWVLRYVDGIQLECKHCGAAKE